MKKQQPDIQAILSFKTNVIRVFEELELHKIDLKSLSSNNPTTFQNTLYKLQRFYLNISSGNKNNHDTLSTISLLLLFFEKDFNSTLKNNLLYLTEQDQQLTSLYSSFSLSPLNHRNENVTKFCT